MTSTRTPDPTSDHRVVAGRYRLHREIGRGGMGVVWRARDEVLGRDVALKRVGLPPADTSWEGTGTDPALAAARGELEARLAASLNHPHVVAVFDLVEDDDAAWLVMEYVPGGTLAQRVRERGPLSPEQVAPILRQVAGALAAAHENGIVHRDVKPSNILVTDDGQAKITDFGIARRDGDPSLTQTGLVTGSPAYLSPEVASGGSAGPPSDVWALGATLFHALTGRPPYDVHGNVVAALYQIVHEAPPTTDRAGRLEPVLAGMLTRDRALRWTMRQVHDALTPGALDHPTATLAAVPGTGAAIQDPPSPSLPRRAARHTVRRTSSAAAAAAVLLGLTGAGVAALHDRSPVVTANSPSSTAGSAGTEASDAPAPPAREQRRSAEQMRTFVEDYLATVTSDPSAAWKRLTPRFQRASGGWKGYRSFWSTIASARVDQLSADPDAMTVTYRVTYRRGDGSGFSDQVTLRLHPAGQGRLQISDEL